MYNEKFFILLTFSLEENFILKNPNDEKYRLFKPSNKAIASKVMVLGDILIRDLIELLGYIPVEEDYMYIGA